MIRLGSGEELPYGVCVWSAGNAPRPLVQQLAAQIPEQVGLAWWVSLRRVSSLQSGARAPLCFGLLSRLGMRLL